MSEKSQPNKSDVPISIRALKITLGRLLLVDPTAYINLCMMFPCEARNIDEISELVLPPDYFVIMMEQRQLLLISTLTPNFLRFDRKLSAWIHA